MPFGVAEGVATAAAVAGNVYNQQSVAKSNLRSRQFNEHWMLEQRKWALQDWNMQNEYNSPVEQRKRMIAAGMNPALMYGSGGSSGLSAPVRSSPTENWRPQPHQVNPMADLTGIYEIIKTQAQTNLVDAQTKFAQSQNAKIQAWLKGLDQFDSADLGTNVQGKQLGYIASDMQSKLGIQNAEWTLKLDENERRNLYSMKNAEQVTERILLMAAQKATTEAQKEQILENIDLMKKSGKLKQYEIDANEILNGAFHGPAARLVFGILKKTGILK